MVASLPRPGRTGSRRLLLPSLPGWYPDRDMDSRLLIDGVRLHFQEIPRPAASAALGRPTLVFLHDSLGSIRQWKEFPGLLGEAAGLDVLVYDRQGYGGSDPYEGARRAKTYLETEADVLEKLL